MKLHAPIYTGQVNGHPVRFFKTPFNDGRPDFVWHAVDDVDMILGLAPEGRQMMMRMTNEDYGRYLRTVATKDGVVTIAPHFMAQGKLGAFASQGAIPESVEFEYVKAAAQAQREMEARIGAVGFEYVAAAFNRWDDEAG
jgi:hypothetical protein